MLRRTAMPKALTPAPEMYNRCGEGK